MQFKQEDAYKILMQKIISQTIQERLDFYIPFIIQAASFTNQFKTTEEVEGAGTALFIIQKNSIIEIEDIIYHFKTWSEDKAVRFSSEMIMDAVIALEKFGFIENTLCGYKIRLS